MLTTTDNHIEIDSSPTNLLQSKYFSAKNLERHARNEQIPTSNTNERLQLSRLIAESQNDTIKEAKSLLEQWTNSNGFPAIDVDVETYNTKQKPLKGLGVPRDDSLVRVNQVKALLAKERRELAHLETSFRNSFLVSTCNYPGSTFDILEGVGEYGVIEKNGMGNDGAKKIYGLASFKNGGEVEVVDKGIPTKKSVNSVNIPQGSKSLKKSTPKPCKKQAKMDHRIPPVTPTHNAFITLETSTTNSEPPIEISELMQEHHKTQTTNGIKRV